MFDFTQITLVIGKYNKNTDVYKRQTLTGSIGIFGMVPNVKGLTDKIGFKRVQKRINNNHYPVYGYRIKPVSYTHLDVYKRQCLILHK